MNRGLYCLLSLAAFLPGMAFAQDGAVGTTETTTEGIQGYPFNVGARVGLYDTTSRGGTGDTNVLGGVSFDWNASQKFGALPLGIYYGATTGLSFTRVSGPGNDVDSNLFIIPVNAVIGYPITERLTAGAHGGANIFLQNDPIVQNVGDGTNNFELFPNAGANVTWTFTNRMAATAMIDWTFTDRTNPFIAALGLSVPIG